MESETVARIVFLAVGLVVGWFGGVMYTTMKYAKEARREARDANREVHKMTERMDAHDREQTRRDEKGFVRWSWSFLGWILVLSVVILSVLRTAETNEDLTHATDRLIDAQEQIARSSACTEQFLGAAVNALNERTEFSTAQAEANIVLQERQLRFLAIVSRPGENDAREDAALSEYLDALREYTQLVGLSSNKAETFPYPTVEGYRMCLNGETFPPEDPPQPEQSPRRE